MLSKVTLLIADTGRLQVGSSDSELHSVPPRSAKEGCLDFRPLNLPWLLGSSLHQLQARFPQLSAWRAYRSDFLRPHLPED